MPWLNVVSRFFSGVSFSAVKCESEVEFDNTEGECWIIDGQIKRISMESYFGYLDQVKPKISNCYISCYRRARQA